MTPQPKDAELFIGVVARVGVDTRKAAEAILEALQEYRYGVTEIKVTAAIKEIEKYSALGDLPTEERYSEYIKACNELRSETKSRDIMARLAISQIEGGRPSHDDDGEAFEGDEALLQRNAYVINQLKREEEMDLLRATYGEHYVQISFHADADLRERQLADRIAHDHAEQPRAENWVTNARALMDRDEAEESLAYGQRVRDVFPRSDVVIDASTPKSMKDGLERFFRALFGDPRVTPTRDEYGMQLANTASLRSADLSRQVGAAILTTTSEIQALGCNEVPKARGGTYWEGDAADGREFQLEKDSNDQRKKEILLDIAARMLAAGIISDDYKDPGALRKVLLDRSDNTIKDSQLMDSLEYGRTVHAEMNAITDAARNGHAVRGCVLYCNTFPCHNCAKHIVASGLGRVTYLLPFPKSYARQLFYDSIAIDQSPELESKISFNQFVGIVGPIFERLFSKSKWKGKDGSVPPFVKREASFIRRTPLPAYKGAEIELCLQLAATLSKNGLAPTAPLSEGESPAG